MVFVLALTGQASGIYRYSSEHYWRYAFHCGSQTRSSFWVKPLRVIAALHKVFQCYSFTSHCFRAGETHAQLRSECGSYIVRARSLTKLATSTPDQECDCLANPVANFINNIIWVCGFISDGKRIINRREL